MPEGQFSGAIMVTTPQEVALMDVRKAMHLFEQVHVPILGIVENMSYYAQADGQSLSIWQDGGQSASGGISIPLLAQIPLDAVVSQCGDFGRLFTSSV